MLLLIEFLARIGIILGIVSEMLHDCEFTNNIRV